MLASTPGALRRPLLRWLADFVSRNPFPGCNKHLQLFCWKASPKHEFVKVEKWFVLSSAGSRNSKWSKISESTRPCVQNWKRMSSVPYFRTKFRYWHPCTRARTALVRCKASMSMFPFTVELSHFGPHLGCAVLNLNASSSRQPTSFCNSHISQCKLEHAGKSFLISSDVFVIPHTFAIFESEAVLTGETSVQPKEKPTYHASHKLPESAWRRWLSMIFNGIVFSKLLDLDEKKIVWKVLYK